jgi:putative ABC transport system permease protein
MTITGILQPSDSPDDAAVFTDIRTAWVIEGIGHGHQELNEQTDPALLLDDDSKNQITASMGVLPYLEINDENRDSFHFHGDVATFPLTAILVVPASEKARVQILGRYSSDSTLTQCIQPPDVIAELLSMVFRVEQLVRVCSIVAVLVTLLLLGLVLNLSLKLRAAEMQTMFRLGCSRLTIVRLQLAEVGVLLTAATGLAVVAGSVTSMIAADAIRHFLF